MNIFEYLSTVINNYELKTLKDLTLDTRINDLPMYIVKSNKIYKLEFKNIKYILSERFINYEFILGSEVIKSSANINTYYHILQGYYVFFSIESMIYWVFYDTSKRMNINLFELIRYLIEINYFSKNLYERF